MVVAGCSKQGADGQGGQMPPPEVGVQTLQPATIPLQRDLVGRLSAFRSADVRARVPGVLQRRVYEEGSDVRKGEVLFLIDPAPLQAALGQAKASQATAQANYANAKSAADRARKLIGQKFISQSDYDNAIAAERSAAAALQAGRAAVDAAEINLGYATVRSPIDGRAGRQQVTEGALVGQGDATLLTTVDQIDPLYVDFSASADELAAARRASDGSGSREVQVTLPDGSVYSHPGTLDFTADVVDPSTGAVALRARLPNPEHQLLPGTFVKLRATLSEQREAYRIPQTAVQRDAQGAYVFVVDQAGKAQRKNIDATQLDGSDWIVSSGVSPGDRVIVSGVQRVMQPGQPVTAKPVEAAKPDAAQAAPATAPKQG
ncbi:efflux RND transporter periplasmic adaptor subunit [Pseudoluteimonas lycopersici]|uniref:Efflux RND transporter periplasmic adaptor subunit n=2 Tax=Pseudoluteimonas lycopersici TaxID=1324796 RepID=A0A516V8E1_9GAMM|nr:efflux RND transporter periplasmic adaptor subunit [Lysobacter lycopersici]